MKFDIIDFSNLIIINGLNQLKASKVNEFENLIV